MQIDSQQFLGTLSKGVGWEENAFRYCTFEGLNEEGGHSTSVFLDCNFVRCEWYWGLFNCAVFVGVTFTECVFRGTSFSGCKFVECEFTRCQFVPDNLGRGCSFDDTRWYGCSKRETQGLEHVREAVL